MLKQDSLRVGMVLEQLRDRIDAHGLAPFDLDLNGLQAEGLREQQPTLAELAAVDDQHLVAGRKHIGDRSLHRAGPRRSKNQDIALGAEERFQTLPYFFKKLGKFRRPVMDDGL